MIYLLVIIYLSFIGLGLPDSILGSAWPVMQAELQVPLSGAGLVTMIVTAARWASYFYLGITVGRFLSGLISDRMGDRRMVRLGQSLILAGAVLLILPETAYLALAGILLIGLGCAPIYPSMLHATPKRFGEARAAGLMGLQMAVAYSGSLTIPPIMGVIGGLAGMWIYPFAILLLVLLLSLGNLRANQKAPM